MQYNIVSKDRKVLTVVSETSEDISSVIKKTKEYAKLFGEPLAVQDETGKFWSKGAEFGADPIWFRPVGRPAGTPGKPLTIYLTADLLDIAEMLGNGNIQAGIREALKKA